MSSNVQTTEPKAKAQEIQLVTKVKEADEQEIIETVSNSVTTVQGSRRYDGRCTSLSRLRAYHHKKWVML